jgi:hypothetical protein
MIRRGKSVKNKKWTSHFGIKPPNLPSRHPASVQPIDKPAMIGHRGAVSWKTNDRSVDGEAR